MVDTKVVTGFGSVAVLVVLHGVEENVKQADQVSRTGHVLRVELNAEKRTKEFKSHTKPQPGYVLAFLPCASVT